MQYVALAQRASARDATVAERSAPVHKPVPEKDAYMALQGALGGFVGLALASGRGGG